MIKFKDFITESPDSIYTIKSKKTCTFLWWTNSKAVETTSKNLLGKPHFIDIDLEDAFTERENILIYAISSPGQAGSKIYLNNKELKLPLSHPTHLDLYFELLGLDMAESDITDEQRIIDLLRSTVISGRICEDIRGLNDKDVWSEDQVKLFRTYRQMLPNESQISFISFWNKSVPSNIIAKIISTMKEIKWSPKLILETGGEDYPIAEIIDKSGHILKEFITPKNDLINSFKDFVNEGGHAVKNVGKIQKDDIDKTVYKFNKDILSHLGIPFTKDALLGSSYPESRLKDEYGDIDILVDINNLKIEDKSDIKKVLAWLAGEIHKINPDLDIDINYGFKTVSVAYPIPGKNTSVQIDLMLSGTPKYTKFIFHSPTKITDTIKRGGMYRNLLLQAIARKGSAKNRAIDVSRGLKMVSDTGEITYLTTPDEIKQELFGTTEVDLDSIYSIWANIKTNPNLKNKLPDIKQYFFDAISPYHKKDPENYPIPILEGIEHMLHVYELPSAKTSSDMVKVFEKIAKSLEKIPATLKVDGLNLALKIVQRQNKYEWAIDKGSKDPLDINGITVNDVDKRFKAGHGMIEVVKKILTSLNKALPSVMNEVKALNIIQTNPNNINVINTEYVEGQTNLIKYEGNFLVMHGLMNITTNEKGSRVKSFVPTNMKPLVTKLDPILKKDIGFNVYDMFKTTPSKMPINFANALKKPFTIHTSPGKTITQPLQKWVDEGITNPMGASVKDKNGKVLSPLSSKVYAVATGQDAEFKSLSELNDNPAKIEQLINGAVILQLAIVLGDEIINNIHIDSDKVKSMKGQEGVVIQDTSIYPSPFKVTGSFIVNKLQSKFGKI